MKLRIRDNSIRLRLSQTEVDLMGKDGLVSARVRFADGAELVYSLESSPACVDPVAKFENGSLSVRLPESTVTDWASSEQVSISAEQGLDTGGYLQILIEKDFACLAPREGEDDSDMFPNPQSGTSNC